LKPLPTAVRREPCSWPENERKEKKEEVKKL